MKKKSIIEKLTTIISPYLPEEIKPSNIKEGADLLHDLKINSAHLIDIILDIENAFNIELADETIEKIFTVQDAIVAVENEIKTQKG